MRLTTATLVAVTLALALTDAARAAATPECLHGCDVDMAKSIEGVTKQYPNHKDPHRLGKIDSCSIHQKNNQALTHLTMKLSLTSALLITVCTLATLATTTEANLATCTNKCKVEMSKSFGKCVKKHPVTDSAGRIQCNEASIAADGKCMHNCRVISSKCAEKCFAKANVAWEPCVAKYKDPQHPKRLKCLEDVEAARVKCAAPCYA
ncbi:hypothetical protein DFQ27_003956 [Actinomortierella ambigua]|uniref:Uncharacterized protein n=1 Tax=Actinomortierella ambigua TaxID=1343610 RepID=A0A9P6U4R0_9FUNG|nr:hypothetical protein DFQ27_003956 [Actinomortierella ambigua]